MHAPASADVDESLEADVDEPLEADVDEPLEADVDELVEADVDELVEADVDEPLEADVDELLEADVDELLEALEADDVDEHEALEALEAGNVDEHASSHEAKKNAPNHAATSTTIDAIALTTPPAGRDARQSPWARRSQRPHTRTQACAVDSPPPAPSADPRRGRIHRRISCVWGAFGQHHGSAMRSPRLKKLASLLRHAAKIIT